MDRKEVTDINRDFLKQIMTADITKGSYPSPFDSSVDVCGFLHSLIHSLENHPLENHSLENHSLIHSLENHSFTHSRIILLKITHLRIIHSFTHSLENHPLENHSLENHSLIHSRITHSLT